MDARGREAPRLIFGCNVWRAFASQQAAGSAGNTFMLLAMNVDP